MVHKKIFLNIYNYFKQIDITKVKDWEKKWEDNDLLYLIPKQKDMKVILNKFIKKNKITNDQLYEKITA